MWIYIRISYFHVCRMIVVFVLFWGLFYLNISIVKNDGPKSNYVYLFQLQFWCFITNSNWNFQCTGIHSKSKQSGVSMLMKLQWPSPQWSHLLKDTLKKTIWNSSFKKTMSDILNSVKPMRKGRFLNINLSVKLESLLL